jgi:uncharacterized protein YbjT (DUF2867 family)
MTILITGATGTVGTEVVNSLVKEYNAPSIRLLVRDTERANKLFSHLEQQHTTKIEYVKGDVTNIGSDTNVFNGVERLFILTLSSPQQKQVELELVRVAINSSPDLKHIVRLSAIGVDLNADSDSLFRWHAEAEHALIEFAEQKKLSFTILRPNLFMQNFLRDDIQSIKEQNVFYRIGLPDRVDYKISHVDVRDIGTAAAVLLTQDPAKHNGRSYNISGPDSLNYKEVAGIVSKKLGKVVDVVPIDDNSLYQALIQNIPDWLAMAIVKLYQYYKLNLTPSITYGDYQILTNKKPRSLEQFFEDHKTVFLK